MLKDICTDVLLSLGWNPVPIRCDLNTLLEAIAL